MISIAIVSWYFKVYNWIVANVHTAIRNRVGGGQTVSGPSTTIVSKSVTSVL